MKILWWSWCHWRWQWYCWWPDSKTEVGRASSSSIRIHNYIFKRVKSIFFHSICYNLHVKLHILLSSLNMLFHVNCQLICPRGSIVTLTAIVWLFTTVDFQVCPQIACLRGCIVALVAFVQIFSTVCFDMSPQIAWIRGYIITLVALVWLFSTVRFQMLPQMACPRRGILALVAFVWLFSTV